MRRLSILLLALACLGPAGAQEISNPATLATLGAVAARPMRVGAWETAPGLTSASGGSVGGGRLSAHPIYIPAAATLDRIAVVTTAAAAQATNVRLGLYADNGGQPGALLVDGGTVALANGAAAGQVLATISYQITGPRWVWGASLADGTLTLAMTYSNPLPLPMSVPAGATGWQTQGWYLTGVSYGALPASPTWLRNDQASNAPVVSVRVGSLP